MTDYQKIPEDLKKLPQWVLREGKKPINPHNYSGAKAGIPSTWGTFEQCLGLSPMFDGIGFEFNDSGIVGIDLDHVIDEIGILSKEARSIVERLNSYTEISPSGTGLHIFVYGDIPGKGRKHTEKGVEIYKSGRYFTMTGDVYGDLKPIEHRDAEIKALFDELFPQDNKDQVAIDFTLPIVAPADVDYNLLDKIRASKQSDKFKKLFDYGDTSGYPSHSEADLALCNMLAYWCRKDAGLMDHFFRMSGLMRKEKWDRPESGYGTSGNRTIQRAIADCTGVYDPESYKKDNYSVTFTESGTEVVTVNGQQKALPVPIKPKVVDSSEYNLMIFKEINWLIENILPDKGFAAVSAKPKVGKTWLCYQVAFAKATGGALMGKQVDKCTVIYFDLETPGRSRKKRLLKFTNGQPIPSGIKFIDTVRKINAGFQEDLEELLKQYPETKVVIVDTIKKIRNPRPTNVTENQHDDTEIGALAKFVNDHDILLLGVNHNTKISNEDPFDNALGSISIQGSLDTILVITQEKDKCGRTTNTMLHVKGREVEEEHYSVSFDDCRWSIVGKAEDVGQIQAKSDLLGNPITTTIKTLISESENREWKGKSAEFIKEFARINKKALAMSGQTFTKWVEAHEIPLVLYCNIEYTKIKHKGTSTIHHFHSDGGVVPYEIHISDDSFM